VVVFEGRHAFGGNGIKTGLDFFLGRKDAFSKAFRLVDVAFVVAYDPSALGDRQAKHFVCLFQGFPAIIGPVNEDNLIVVLLYPARVAFAIATHLFPERPALDLCVPRMLLKIIHRNRM
jgi:hypothetical protein